VKRPTHVCGPGCQHVRVEAPAGWDELTIAQAVVGPHLLVKAESAPFDVWYRDRPMKELSARFVDAYRALLKRMLAAIQKYVEHEITHGPLHKAERVPVLVTPEQLDAIRKIIGDYHTAFIAGGIDPEAVSPAEVQRLMDAGVISGDLAFVFHPATPQEKPPEAMRAIDDAWRYGYQLGMVAHPSQKRPIEKLSYEDWREGAPQPELTPAERAALDWSRKKAAQHIRGLGNVVADDFSTAAIEADEALRRETEEAVREILGDNVELREAWRSVVTDLGDRTDDWARDLGRIAATEKHDAIQRGQARAMKKKHGRKSGDVRVAKQPNPDACKHCVRLFTDGGKPKIFWLSELEANGTNVGRKTADWLPTVGPVHPWCACELIEVPEGWGFDDEGNMIPEALKRSATLEGSLRKSAAAIAKRPMLFGGAGGDDGITVRIGDPLVRAAVEEVVARTPVEIFTRATGVTMITTDHPRETNMMDEGDLAYWTGNEIRIVQSIEPARVTRVLEHEIGHSLNAWLRTKFGTTAAVRAWHDRLWAISKDEGFVTKYAAREPIENAAEVTRLFIYYRERLLRHWPRQFALCYRAYGDLLKRKPR
jgi:hypothetical protein